MQWLSKVRTYTNIPFILFAICNLLLYQKKRLSIYAIFTLALYFTFTSLNTSVIKPATKKLTSSSSKSKSDRSRPNTIVPFTPKLNTDSGKLESFDSDWIPKDHLHVKKSVSTKVSGATSGSESEGGAKKRK